MKKPLYTTKVNYDRSEALDLLVVERKILEYLHKDSEHHFDDVQPITEHNLFDFWRRVQKNKDLLKDVERADKEE